MCMTKTDELREELREQFEAPAKRIQAELLARKEELRLEQVEVDEQLRMVNAVLRPLDPNYIGPGGRRKGEPMSKGYTGRNAGNGIPKDRAAKMKRVREYVLEHGEAMGVDIMATPIYETLNAGL